MGRHGGQELRERVVGLAGRAEGVKWRPGDAAGRLIIIIGRRSFGTPLGAPAPTTRAGRLMLRKRTDPSSGRRLRFAHTRRGWSDLLGARPQPDWSRAEPSRAERAPRGAPGAGFRPPAGGREQRWALIDSADVLAAAFSSCSSATSVGSVDISPGAARWAAPALFCPVRANIRTPQGY